MKKLGWILYGLSFLFLTIKLINICLHQYELFEVAYSLNEFSFDLMLGLFVKRGFFIEPILITISIIGLLLRKRIGFIIALIFSYYIMTNMLLNLTPFNLYYTTTDIAQLIFALMVLAPLHYKETFYIFRFKWTYKRILISNLIALSIGFATNILYQLTINSFVN